MKTLQLFILLIALPILGQSQVLNFEQDDWEKFQQENKRNKTFYYVEFYTNWCGYCRLLDRTTFKDPEVIRFTTEYYKTFKLNAEGPNGVNIAKNYRVTAYPTILFFDPNGEVIHRQNGYAKPAEFLKVMQSVQMQYKFRRNEELSHILTNQELDLWFSEELYDNERAVFTKYPCYEKAIQTAEDNKPLEEQKYGKGQLCTSTELFYNFGKGNLKEVIQQLDKDVDQLKFNVDVLEFFVLQFLAKGETHPTLIKWTNSLFYAKPNYETGLLKSYAYYLENQKIDATDALKRAKKLKDKKAETSVLEKELKKVL